MSYKAIHLIGGVNTNIGSALFFNPLGYNTTSRLPYVIKSKYHVIGRCISASIGSAYSGLILLSVLRQIHTGPFQLAHFLTSVKLVAILVTSLLSIFQWNFLLKAQEWGTFWKQITIFGNGFEERNRRTMNKTGILCECLTILIIILVYLVVLMYVYMCSFQCNAHFHSDIFPFCDEENPRKHRSTPIMAVNLAILTLVGMQYANNCQLVACLILVAVIGCQRILREMRNQIVMGTIGNNQKKAKQWNTDYRSLQILFDLISDCIRDWIVPSFFVATSALMVTINYMLLVIPNIDISVQCLGVTINFIVVFYLIAVVQLSSTFLDMSMEVVRDRKSWAEENKDLQTAKLMDSFSALRIWVGPFFYFTRQMVPEIFQFVSSSTVDATLTF